MTAPPSTAAEPTSTKSPNSEQPHQGSLSGHARPRPHRQSLTIPLLGFPWLRRLLLRLVSVSTLIGAWWAISAVGQPDPTLRPSPLLVWNTLVDLSTLDHGGYNGLTWWQQLGVSLRRVGIGAGAGVLAGLLLGLAMGIITPLRICLEPLLTFVRNLPPLAYFSLVVIWFGIDEAPKILSLAIAALPPVAVVTAQAVGGTPRSLIEAGRSIGLSRIGVIRNVILPSTLPDVLTGIRLSVAISYSSLVAAETVNGLPGIGGMVRDAQAYNNTAVVVVGILAIGISGLIIDAAIAAVAARVSPWRALA